MQQNKMIPVAVWITCLTIAAYVLAQAAAMIMSRSFDAALLKNASTVAQNRSESAVSLLPRLNAPGLNESAKVAVGDSDRGVQVERVSDTRWILDRASMLSSPPMATLSPSKLAVPENLANVRRWHADVSARPSAKA